MKQAQKKTVTGIFLTSSFLLMMACSPKKVQTNTSASSSSSSSSQQTALTNSATSTNVCQLSGPTQFSLGTTTNLMLTFNFSIPSGSRLFWSGSNNGSNFQNDEDFYGYRVSYSDPSMAGPYTKSFSIVSPAGDTLCTSNTFSFQLVQSTAADQNCVSLGGAVQSQNCAISDWTLFSAMSNRGLIKSQPIVGGANPATVNCSNNGGIDNSGTCSINKTQLMNIINVTGQ